MTNKSNKSGQRGESYKIKLDQYRPGEDIEKYKIDKHFDKLDNN